jgi:Kef-type K+ transport system membrane component KefB
LGLALLSEQIGIAAIIGAFLAGMVLADRSEQDNLLHKSETLVALFLPFFLVNIGMQVSLDAFKSPIILGLAVLITFLAVIGKYFGGLLAARGLGKRTAAQVGMGMVPRGEVGIVAAQLGLTLGVLDTRLFAVVLFMAVATTLIAPPFLRRLFAGEDGEPSEFIPDSVVEERPVRLE